MCMVGQLHKESVRVVMVRVVCRVRPLEDRCVLRFPQDMEAEKSVRIEPKK